MSEKGELEQKRRRAGVTQRNTKERNIAAVWEDERKSNWFSAIPKNSMSAGGSRGKLVNGEHQKRTLVLAHSRLKKVES